MTDAEQPDTLFVRELVQILAAHGLKLDQLVERVGLEEATVERFQIALANPLLDPVLSLDEQDLLVRSLLLNATEQGRLQAALLATALKCLLKNQLGLDYARQITAQVYPLLLTASLQAVQGTLGDTTRTSDHDSREDRTWAAIWEAMDSAGLAMQLSRGFSKAEQMRRLREACAYLEEALEALDGLDGSLKSLLTWRTCHKKASKDLKAAHRRLRLLETK